MKKITTAFVFGAGLGTRLRPLTENCPKPLLPVNGRPLISYAFEHLAKFGIQRLIVNTHHCAKRYADFFPNAEWEGIPIIFRYEPELLETGGGLKNIEDLIKEESILVYNGDVITDLPLHCLVEEHQKKGNEVTLALRSTGGPLHVALDENNKIRDIRRQLSETKVPEFLFTGVYVIEPSFLKRLKTGKKESVIPIFLDMIRTGQHPGGIVIDEGNWCDVGTIDVYKKLNEKVKIQSVGME